MLGARDPGLIVGVGFTGGAEVGTTGLIGGDGATSDEAGNSTPEMSSCKSSGGAPEAPGKLLSVEGFVLFALG